MRLGKHCAGRIDSEAPIDAPSVEGGEWYRKMAKRKRKVRKDKPRKTVSPATDDADMEAYIRSPYDPVYGPKIFGRIVGISIARLWRRLRRR